MRQSISVTRHCSLMSKNLCLSFLPDVVTQNNRRNSGRNVCYYVSRSECLRDFQTKQGNEVRPTLEEWSYYCTFKTFSLSLLFLGTLSHLTSSMSKPSPECPIMSYYREKTTGKKRNISPRYEESNNDKQCIMLK